MKKTFLLTTAMGFLGASSLLAAQADIYITGATAFRASVYTACTKLYSSAPSIYYGDAAHGGAGSGFGSKTASWCMTGTPISGLSSKFGSGPLVIHGLFTGSIQGLANVEQKTKLVWATPAGTLSGGLTSGYVTNTPTIGFSDASGVSSPYPATGNYVEEKVAMQPFVFVKSVGSGAAATALAKVTGVTWDQMEYRIPQGRLALSAWTYKTTDTNTFIYLVERTSDSGTRRNFTAEQAYQFNDPFGVYIFDVTNNFWFAGTNSNNSLIGSSPNGIVGAAGLGNVNLNWGSGYVGGGDIATELGYTNSANAAIAFLSIADARAINNTATNWTQVLPVNGIWPSTVGAGISGSTSNNYAPITTGYYPCWGAEVLVHPVDMTAYTDQNVTSSQLGSQTSPGSFLGVFNAQTYINGGSPIVGSIENEIELSKSVAPGATAIRLNEMINNRASDGGIISPPFN